MSRRLFSMPPGRRLASLALMAGVGVGAFATVGVAQQADAIDAVQGHGATTATDADPVVAEAPELPPPPPAQRPGYDPLGLRHGAFLIFPTIEVDAIHTDNVRQEKTGRRDDVGLRLAPSLALRSDWVRHSLSLRASGEFIFYDKETAFDEMSADIVGEARVDITRAARLDLRASYALSEDDPASSETPGNASERRQNHEIDLDGQLVYRAGRFEGRLLAGVNVQSVSNVALTGGGEEDNADRNYVEPRVGLRLGYHPSPNIAPFIQVVLTPRLHDRKRDRNGLKRDSQGVSADAGLEFSVSDIWTGQVGVRYLARTYDDPALSDLSSFGLIADLTWRPNVMTAVNLSAETGIEESTQAGVSGARTFNLGIAVTHALSDEWALRASVAFEFTDYAGSSNDDYLLRLEAGAAYTIVRGIEVTGAYRFTDQTTGDGAGDYSENRVSVGLRYRL